MPSEKLKSSLTALIERDNRNFYERTRKKRPKMNILINTKELLCNMLFSLYSVSDILIELNSMHGFSISDTTLMKFFKTHLVKEYELTQKMRHFYYKIVAIDKLKDAGETDYKTIYQKLNFSGKINSKKRLDLDIKDFQFFWENYYIPDLKKNGVKSYSELILKANEHFGNNEYPDYINIPQKNNDCETVSLELEPDDEIVSISIPEIVNSEKDIDKKTAVIQSNDDEKEYLDGDVITNECGLTEKVVDFFVRDLSDRGIKPDLNAYYAINHEKAPNEAAKAVRKAIEKPLGEINYKFEFFKNCRFKNTYKPINLGALPSKVFDEREKFLIKSIFDEQFHEVDYKDIINNELFEKYKDFQQIVVHENNDFRKIEPLNRMRDFSMDYQKEVPLEKFVYFPEIWLLQIADLSTLGFVDGQAVLIHGNTKLRDSFEYDLYRYYKGELYFIEPFKTSGSYSPSAAYYIDSNFDMIATAKFKIIATEFAKFY